MDSKKINKLISQWDKFAKSNKIFKLNPDQEWVKSLALGVLNNEKNHGFKYCPCRLASGDKEKDLALICPCNFFIQDTWKKKGECWCGLFHKINK